MSTISALQSEPRGPTLERASHRRIRHLSGVFSIGLGVLLALSVIAPAALIFVSAVFPSHISCGITNCELTLKGPVPAGFTTVSQMSLVTRLAGLVDLVLAALPPFFILWHLRALFRLYAAGRVFARENAAQLQRIGLWLMLLLPVKFISNLVFRLAGGSDHAWLHATGIYALILGAIVMVIAKVMELGHEIEKEHGEFV